jgi:hypothetical protein
MGFQSRLWIHHRWIRLQLPLLNPKSHPAEIDGIPSQDWEHLDHIFHHTFGKGRRAGFILVKGEKKTLFPKYSERGKVNKLGDWFQPIRRSPFVSEVMLIALMGARIFRF